MALFGKVQHVFLLLASSFLLLSKTASAPPEPVPDPHRGMYAIWSDSLDTTHMPFLVGGQVVLQWGEVQPAEGRYDFSTLRAQLEKLDRLGRVTSVQLNGNALPAFMYAKVPHHPEALNVQVRSRKGTLQYWHPYYIKAYTDLIAAFARELKSSPYRSRVIGVRFNYNAIGTEGMIVMPNKRDPAQWIAPPGVTPAPAWTEEIATAYRHTVQQAYVKDFLPEIRVFMRPGVGGYPGPDQDAIRLAEKEGLGLFTTASEIEPRVPSMYERYNVFLGFCRPGKGVCYAESMAPANGHHPGKDHARWCAFEQYNYWRLLSDLNLGFSMIGITGEDLEQTGDPEFRAAFDFAARYAGYHASPSVSPGAWVALREGSLLLKGDYSFLMRRLDGVAMKPEQKIGPDDQRFGAWALTLPKGGEVKFALDPAFAGSLKKATVRVTYLDRGTGAFTLRTAGQEFQAKLTATGRWKTAQFDASHSPADIAITADTLLTLHMVEVAR
jgi:hypothetical protein